MLSQERLKELVHYNPDTGVFTWLKPQSRRIKVGDIAKVNKSSGYIRLGIDGNRYQAHRLAFLYMTGIIPEFVDHKDTDRSNNKWDNLRSSSRGQNNRNITSKVGKSRFKGVCPSCNPAKWTAQITHNYKKIHIGSYDTEEEAAIAYNDKAVALFGEFANLNVI